VCKRCSSGTGTTGICLTRNFQFLRWEIGNIDIGVGTLQATNNRVFEAINKSVSQLREWVKQQPHVHVDESPWPVLGLKEWLWVSASQEFCLFYAGDTRLSSAELQTQLGNSFDGVLSSDDFGVYNGYPVKAQQKCLAKKATSLPQSHQVGLRQQPRFRASVLGLTAICR